MDDMGNQINALLNDPDAMSRILQMAQQLSGGGMGGDTGAQSHSAPTPPPPPKTGGLDLDPQLLLKFLPLLQGLRQSNNQTTQLLYALRPFLKEERQGKVERAAKLAHLICIGKKFLTEGGLELV